MFGLHVSKAVNGKTYKTHGEAIAAAKRIYHIAAAQIFTHGPANTRKNSVNLTGADIPVFVHSAYMCVGIWKNPKLMFLIESELKEAELRGAAGLVVHLQSVPPAEIARVCHEIYKKYPFQVPLLLETPSLNAAAENNYSHANNLAKLGELLEDAPFPWGFCVDTSHLWASGVEVETAEQMNDWLTAVPSEKIKLIHLNANYAKNFSTGKDFHIIPFSPEDGIWGKIDYRQSGFAAIVKFAKKNYIPCVLEVNRGEDSSLHHAYSLFGKI